MKMNATKLKNAAQATASCGDNTRVTKTTVDIVIRRIMQAVDEVEGERNANQADQHRQRESWFHVCQLQLRRDR